MIRSLFLFSVLCLGCVTAAEISVIPKPVSCEKSESAFTLSAATQICFPADSKELQAEAALLSESLLALTGWKLETTSAPKAGQIVLTQEGADAALGDEGYELSVESSKVLIKAQKPAGVFHGTQTLRQLLPPPAPKDAKVEVAWIVPAVKIKDQPRFGWRGYMIDCGRYFPSKEMIKRSIDLMAYYKLNTFHWHLTEDQGWRIEIKKYPKLTELGSWRGEGDKKFGGFYTQEEIKEVVAYAAARYINVVPEIEMPGHSQAALTAYPQYSCTGGPFKVATGWGVMKDVYCPGNEESFTFLQDILTEVFDLFPSKYVHIGGDECPKDRWKACPKCQARIKENNLKDEHELQSYFMQRMDKFLTSKGRKLVGWDEILEGGLTKGATVMTWRDIKYGITAAKQGNDVVMTPVQPCYISIPHRMLPLEKVYNYEPIPKELTPEEGKHILGSQGTVWGEYMPKDADVEYTTWPRLIAIAELTWTPAASKSFPDFSERLKEHEPRTAAWNITFPKFPGESIGFWDNKALGSKFKNDVDATKVITAPGTYELLLAYERGGSGASFASVALLENGTEIAKDTHESALGFDNRRGVYVFEVKDRKPDAKYAFKIQLTDKSGTSCTGSMFVRKVK